MLKVEKPQMIDGYPNFIKGYICPNCNMGVLYFHRYCWFCGAKLIHKKEEVRDAYEIHSGRESQLSELRTYGKDAQFVEPKSR